MRNLAGVSDPKTLISERIDQLLAKADPTTTDPVEFRGLQYDLGLAWVHFPEGWGGLDAPPNLQREIDKRLREAQAPPIGARHFFGLTMAGPTTVTHGSEELKTRMLRRIRGR